MEMSVQRIEDLEQLRHYVNETLCHNEQLIENAFQMTQRILLRNGKPCGIYFCVHGPRSVKVTAIWETDRNTILFYGSTGERYKKIRLVAAPKVELAAA
jgi:hypothetical protein